MSENTLCEPCKREGQTIHATKQCIECKESYCEDCSSFHSAQKQSKSHELITLEAALEAHVTADQDSFHSSSINIERNDVFEESLANPTFVSSDSLYRTSDDVPITAYPSQMVLENFQPDIPEGVRSDATSVVLAIKNDAKLNIQLQYKKEHQQRWLNYKDTIPGENKEFEVHGLDPNTSYTFRVKLVNDDTGDESLFSKGSAYLTTQKANIPGVPKLVKAKADSIVLAWDDAPDLSSYHKYEVSYKSSRSGKWSKYPSFLNTGCQTYEIRDLTPSTEYEFRVRVIDDDSGDEWPKGPTSKSFKTLKEVKCPGKPNVIKVGETSVKIKWACSSKLQKKEAFQVAYSSDSFHGHWNLVDDYTEKTEFIVSGLRPGSNYKFKVRIVNTSSMEDEEFSECSEIIRTQETNSRPGKPEIMEISSTSVRLRWRLIHDDDESDVTEYQVWYKCLTDNPRWILCGETSRSPFGDFDIKGLMASMTYQFRVRKIKLDTEEESDYSPVSDEFKTEQKTRTPGVPVLVSSDDKSITVNWAASTLNEEETFELSYKSDMEEKWKIFQSETSCKSHQCDVTGLSPETGYKFKCRVVNATTLDSGPFGDESQVLYTKKYQRKMTPTTPFAIDTTATTIEVQWERPEGMTINENFEILFKAHGHGRRWKCLEDYLSSDKTTVIVHSLQPDTEYVFKVQVVDASNEEIKYKPSQQSDPIKTFKREDKIPGRPYWLDVGPDWITLSWNIPLSVDENDTFVVCYREKGEDTWITTEEYLSFDTSTYTVCGLESDAAYKFKVKMTDMKGRTEESIDSDYIRTLMMLTAPGKPCATQRASHSVHLIWEEAADLQPGDIFKIFFKESTADKWLEYETKSSNNSSEVKGLKSGTTYQFKVRVANESTCNQGEFSDESDFIKTKESPALEMAKHSAMITSSSGASKPTQFYLPLRQLPPSRNESHKTRKVELGEKLGTYMMKTILLMGETGSGKSTLINSLANYLLEVEFQDDVRFHLVHLEKEETVKVQNQAQSQTEWMTTYIVHPSCGSRLDYTLNIIDTPGFGDTRGIDYDERIVQQIRHLFTSDRDQGISYIDAVCFILRAPDSRLTAKQNYIFQSILALFGKNIAENIFLFVTFADSKTPAVLAAIKKSELKDKPLFLFNSCALYCENVDTGKESTSLIFWRKSMKGFEDFFLTLRRTQTKSLTLSAEVLEQRETIEHTVLHLQLQIDRLLSKVSTLEDEIRIFRKHKNEIKDNENFEYEVEEIEFVKEDISGKNIFTTNCMQCNFTCHESCRIKEDNKKYKCVAINKAGVCKVCPGSCNWQMHANVPFIIRQVPRKVRKTYADMQARYTTATEQKLTHEQIIARIGEEIAEYESDIDEKMGIIAQCNNKLKNIALNPDLMKTTDYIDLMIKAEEREKKPGFKQRINSLEKSKKRFQIFRSVDGVKERLQTVRDLTDTPELEELCIGKMKKFWTGLKRLVRPKGQKPIAKQRIRKFYGKIDINTLKTTPYCNFLT